MAQRSTTCPSCGAPITFTTLTAVMVVCEYCDHTVVREDLDIKNVGKMATLIKDASPLTLGLTGSYQGRAFTIIGRLQIEYSEGLWNEWCVRFDERKSAWLSEAMGEYLLFQPVVKPGAAPDLSDLRVGVNVPIGKRFYTVTDIRHARCVSGQGELPSAVGSGYEFSTVDLRSHSLHVATLDYSESPPLQFEGLVQDFDDFGFRDARRFDGWS